MITRVAAGLWFDVTFTVAWRGKHINRRNFSSLIINQVASSAIYTYLRRLWQEIYMSRRGQHKSKNFSRWVV